jgi:hypothetical protein
VENQVFNVNDTIHIDATITDEVNLQSVMVELTDLQLTGVQSPNYFYPQSASDYKLKTLYPITNQYLETGDYYLLIRANNESNYRNKYLKIFINELPLQFEGLLAVTEKALNHIGVSSVTDSGSVNSLFEIYGDYAGSESDSRHRQIYLAGKNFINVQAYHFETSGIAWSKDPEPPLPMHPDNCLCFDEELYVSFASFDIIGYRYNGSVVFTASVEEGLLPSRVFSLNDYVVVDLQSKTGSFNYLGTFYKVSGVEKHRLANNFIVVDFWDYTSDRIIVVTNNDSGGMLMEFNPDNNVLVEITDTPDRIICSLKLSETDFFISTEGGNFLFNSDQETLTSVLPGVSPKRLRFEPVNQNIYSAGSNLIEVISYPDMTVQNTFTLTDSILNFHLIHSK